MYKYNAIKVDVDHEYKFMRHYQYHLNRIQELYNNGSINYKQFVELQTEFFKNSYADFFVQEVNVDNDLIEIV